MIDDYAYLQGREIKWLMAKRTIQACPVCNEKNKLQVMQLNWE